MSRLLALFAALFLMASAAFGAGLQTNTPIAAQPLAEALKDFAAQTGLQVVYGSELARGVKSNGAAAGLPVAQALQELLKGTGLEYEFVAEKTVAIRAPSTASTAIEPDPVLKLAQNAENKDAKPQYPTEGKSHLQEEEIVVTGSHIRGSVPAGANLSVIDREDIVKSGRGTLFDVLQMQTEVHGSGPSELRTQSTGNLGSASAINLRGLGPEETLTLLNGRRLAPSGRGGQFTDVSAIPLGAVERIEVLADGASATYGSDAMAGVVNVILRQDFNGAETRVRSGMVTDGPTSEIQGSQLFGKAWDGGHAMVAYEYYHRGGLLADDRDFAASTDKRPLGGTDQRTLLSNPGNISSPTALRGAIPPGQNGTALTPSQILIGQTNLQNANLGVSLLPKQERHSLFVSASQALSPRWELYVDALASIRKSELLVNAPTATLTVPLGNAYRQLNGLHGPSAPLNQAIQVQYSFNSEFGPNTQYGRAPAWTTNAGARLNFGQTWQADFYGSYGASEPRTSQRSLDTRSAANGGALNIALASGTLASAFNPFGDGSQTAQAVLDTLLGTSESRVETRHSSLNAALSGEIFDVAGGAIKLAFGGEYRDEAFSSRDFSQYAAGVQPAVTALDGDRSVVSAFSELYVPIFSERNRRAGLERLEMSVSGRYDRYSDFGDTVNPKIGVRWMPAEAVSLRASYGTSFKAPLLSDLFSGSLGQVALAAGSFGGPDPNGDGFTNFLGRSGGNAELQPEKGRTWTFGVNLSPPALPGLTASAGYFNIRFKDRFSSGLSSVAPFQNPAPYLGLVYFPTPSQALVDSYIASVSRFVTALPAPGTIEAIVDSSVRNLSIVEMDGIDFRADYQFQTPIGALGISADVTYTLKFDQQFTPEAPVEHKIDTAGFPVKTKLRGAVDWSKDAVAVQLAGNYVASSSDLGPPVRTIGSWTTFDLNARYDFDRGSHASRWSNGATLSLSVRNLFDTDPPFFNQSYGFDGANAHVLGRFVSFEASKRW